MQLFVPQLVLWCHVIGAVLGQLAALGASVVSLLFLYRRKQLKMRQVAVIFRSGLSSPSLESLTRALALTLRLGLALLTFTLLSGIMVLRDADLFVPSAMKLKIAWAVAVWLWYCVLCVTQRYWGLSSSRTAQLSLGGFALLTTTFYGMLFGGAL